MEVVTTKSRAVEVFKALGSLRQLFGFRLSAQDFNIQPSDSQLQAAMQHMLLQMLSKAGWQSLQPGLLLSESLRSEMQMHALIQAQA